MKKFLDLFFEVFLSSKEMRGRLGEGLLGHAFIIVTQIKTYEFRAGVSKQIAHRIIALHTTIQDS